MEDPLNMDYTPIFTGNSLSPLLYNLHFPLKNLNSPVNKDMGEVHSL